MIFIREIRAQIAVFRQVPGSWKAL
jgi:hypothetical protein